MVEDTYISKRLNQFTNREGDYTGLEIPTVITVKRAREIIDIIRNKTPNVVPTEDGSINFIWLVNGYDVEIEISEDDIDIVAWRTTHYST